MCLADCEGYCNGAECISDCLDPVACKSSCEGKEAEYGALCSESCITGCEEKLRGQGGDGSDRDLLHNLIRIRGGDGSAYLENTYGTDPDNPGFDRVISQRFGDTTTTYAYYPLKEGVSGISSADRPLVDVSTPLPEVCPCPNVKASPGDGPTWWLEIEQNLFGLVTGPGRLDRSERVSPERMTVEGVELDGQISHVELDLADDRLFSPNSTATTLSRVQITVRPALHVRDFRLRAPNGSWDLSRVRDERGDVSTYEVSGAVDGLRELFEGGRLSIMRSGIGLVAFTGQLVGVVELRGGRCAGDFGLALDERSDVPSAVGSPVCDGPVEVRPLGSGMAPFRGQYARPGVIPTLTFSRTGFSMSSSPGDLPPADCSSPTSRRPDGAQDRPTVSTPGPAVPLLPPTPEMVVCWFPPEDVLGCVVDAQPFYGAEGVLAAKAALATVIRDGDGLAWTYYSDDGGRVVKMVNHATTTSWVQTYDAKGRRSGYRSEYGDRHCWDYDGDWNTVWNTRYPAFPTPGTSPWITVGLEWTANQRMTRRYRPNTTTSVFEVDWNTLNGAVKETRVYPKAGEGLVTRYTTDARGRLTKRQSYDAGVMTIGYDASTGLANYVWRGGEGSAASTEPVESHRLYDDLGRVIGSYGTAEPSVVQSFDLDGLITQSAVAFEPGVIVSHTMTPDDDGRIASVEGAGLRREFKYDPRGMLRAEKVISLSDPAQQRTSCYLYNQQLRLIETVDPAGRRVRMKRDGFGNVHELWVGAPEKTTTAGNAWDASCVSPAAEVQAPFEVVGSSTLNAMGASESETAWPFVTTTSYDGYGRPLQRSETTVQPDEARDVVRRWAWDDSDNVVASGAFRLAPGLSSTGVSYLPDLSDPHLLAHSAMEYDALGRQKAVHQAWFVDVPGMPRSALGSGTVTSLRAYQDAQRRVVATDDDGVSVVTTYDGLGRPVSEAWPDGTVRTSAWADGGLRVTLEIPAPVPGGKLVETAEWTKFGAVRTAESGGSLQYTATFTARGEVATATTPLESTGYDYSVFGEVTRVQRRTSDGSGTETLQLNTYLPDGTLSAVTDGKGSQTTFAYDHIGRLSLTTYEGTGTSSSLTYLGGSLVPLTSTQRDGVLHRYAYGPFGDVREVSAQSGGAFAGKLSTLTTVNGVSASTSTVGTTTISRSHVLDSLGRRAESQQSNSALPYAMTWTSAGRLKTTGLAGLGLQRDYDSAGNWKSTRSVVANATPFVDVERVGFTPKGFTWSSGIKESLKFDVLGEGLERTAKLGSKTVSLSKVFRTDAGVAWRRDRTISGTSVAQSIARDGYGRLTHEWASSLGDAPTEPPTQTALNTARSSLWKTSFDAADNPEWLGEVATTLGSQNQLTSAFGKALQYDSAGRLTSMGAEQFSYDPFGRLVTAQGPLGRWRFEYDASSVLAGWEREVGRVPMPSLATVAVLPLTSGEFVRVDGGKVRFIDAAGALLATTPLVGDVAGVAGASLLTVEVNGSSRMVRRFVRSDDQVEVTTASLGGAWPAGTSKVGASVHSEGLDVVSITNGKPRVERYRVSSSSTTWPLFKTFTDDEALGLPTPWLVATSGERLAVVGATGVGKHGTLAGSDIQMLGDIDVSAEVSQPLSASVHDSGVLLVASAAGGAVVRFDGATAQVRPSPHRGVVSATSGFDRLGAGGGFFSAAHGESLLAPERMAFHHQGVALVATEHGDGHKVLLGLGDGMLPVVGLSDDGPTFMHAAVGPQLAMLTNAQGQVVESYQGTAYGDFSIMSPSGVKSHASALGVTMPMGQPRLGPAGLSRFGMRWYRPNLLRWMTPDPIGLAGGVNLYSYVGNMPLSYWDPLGLERKLEQAMRRVMGGNTLFDFLPIPSLPSFDQADLGLLVGLLDSFTFNKTSDWIINPLFSPDSNGEYEVGRNAGSLIGGILSLSAFVGAANRIAGALAGWFGGGGSAVLATGVSAPVAASGAGVRAAALEGGWLGANAIENSNRLLSEGRDRDPYSDAKSKGRPEELPALDGTGKVHGTLPRPENFKDYSVADLKLLRDQLKVSVRRRIEVTVQMGSDFGHSARQAAEQQLLKSLEKYLGGL